VEHEFCISLQHFSYISIENILFLLTTYFFVNIIVKIGFLYTSVMQCKKEKKKKT